MKDGRLFHMPATKLTDRQQTAYDAVKAAGYNGLTSAQLGAVVHPHKDDERCEFCKTAGTELGRALRKKGLVQLRRRADSGGYLMAWTVTGPSGRVPERDYDLPPGF